MIINFSKNKKKYNKKLLTGYKFLYRFDYQKNLNQYFKEIDTLMKI